ncbi:MAG: RDD family protein [Neisseria sp.]|nr:RDD family protein [Neisseria sp.]
MNHRPLIDTLYHAQSPEAVDIVLHPAGIVPRARAFFVDGLIRFLLLFALILLVFSLDDYFPTGVLVGLLYLVLFTVVWLYPVLFEVWWQGQTPGKKLFKLRVVQDNGTPITFTASLIRNLMRTIDMLPFAYGGGMVCMLLHPQFKRAGDMLAGSLVIHIIDRREKVRKKTLANVTAAAPPFALSRDERYAVVTFAERLPQLSPARAQELADELLASSNVPPPQRVAVLKAWAKYLLGEQHDFQQKARHEAI